MDYQVPAPTTTNSNIVTASSSSCIAVRPNSGLLCNPRYQQLVGEFLRKAAAYFAKMPG